MKPETKTWNKLNVVMRGHWFAHRIETDTVNGFPDVVYTCQGTTGKLELKTLPAFPAKIDTKVQLHRFTIQQVNHALNTQYHGGKAGMFVEIGKELFYFEPHMMKIIFSGVNTSRFRNLASWYCGAWSEFNVDEFIKEIV